MREKQEQHRQGRAVGGHRTALASFWNIDVIEEKQ